ncbi:glycoside hydrolase family 61 protein [Schizophyllum fasciatum]
MVILHTTLATLAIPLVAAHYKFPNLIVDGVTSEDWEYVRLTWNQYTSEPATDVTADAIRCYELDDTIAGKTGVANVPAGATVGFHADNTMGHPGANSNEAGLGKTWFKIWEWSPSYSPNPGLVFDSENIVDFNFTIPKAVPSGGEQIALHAAGTEGGAQFYIACAQINIENGGSGTPTPTVSFPGAYSPTDPGILINIYNLPDGYDGYEAHEVMPEDASCTCGAGAPYSCALLLILFMLIFYALALWDRYLKLKTREAMRLYTKDAHRGLDSSLRLCDPLSSLVASSAVQNQNRRYAGA